MERTKIKTVERRGLVENIEGRDYRDHLKRGLEGKIK